MSKNKLPLITLAAALSLGLGAAGFAQTYIFRTDMTGSTGDPNVLLTLVEGSGRDMQLNAAGAEPGAPLDGDTRTLTYRNEVSRDITVTSVSISPNQDNFVILPGGDECTGTVVMGGECNITVQFRASEDGEYDGRLIISAS